MKTLLFTLEYPLPPDSGTGQAFYGGVANYYENIVKYYPEKDNIFVLHNNDYKLTKPHWLFGIFKLLKEIKDKKIDHILVGHILPLGTVVYLLSKFIKINYTVIMHGMDFTFALKKARKKRITKKILLNSRNIICSNSYLANLVKNFLGDEHFNKVYIVNPGITELQITPASTSEAGRANYKLQIDNINRKHRLFNKIVLFSVGRLVKRKGFDMVIKSMAEAVRQVPNLYYFMAGDGPDKKYLYELAKGVPNIVFLGRISDEEKWTWLRNCDIFITPSREIEGDFEGFGIVYLEANICTKPVIAGDSGGVRDAVKGAYSGILVDPEDTNQITGAIVKLAQDPGLRKTLGGQGRERALKEFRWEDKVKEIYNIININK